MSSGAPNQRPPASLGPASLQARRTTATDADQRRAHLLRPDPGHHQPDQARPISGNQRGLQDASGIGHPGKSAAVRTGPRRRRQRAIFAPASGWRDSMSGYGGALGHGHAGFAGRGTDMARKEKPTITAAPAKACGRVVALEHCHGVTKRSSGGGKEMQAWLRDAERRRGALRRRPWTIKKRDVHSAEQIQAAIT
ncbi:hypothetical protein AURDEDRAFT_167846 [Auricularia subglabra TFB-10046 SS5]|nr:hypothetical protein AURDEDRAFT_167846 [Auricularia subglabra TFB-10046 SS5]